MASALEAKQLSPLPELVPGSLDCLSGALPFGLQSETSSEC